VVPLVWPSSVATAEVEAMSVALAQPKGDTSCAGMPEPREAWAESWSSRGAQQKSRAPRGGA
jgi:hypothetical protein